MQDEADEVLSRALAAAEGVSGESHPRVSLVLAVLAGNFARTARVSYAEGLYRCVGARWRASGACIRKEEKAPRKNSQLQQGRTRTPAKPWVQQTLHRCSEQPEQAKKSRVDVSPDAILALCPLSTIR